MPGVKGFDIGVASDWRLVDVRAVDGRDWPRGGWGKPNCGVRPKGLTLEGSARRRGVG